MELYVNRISSGDESTLGTMHDITIRPEFMCYVLEDQYQEVKVPGETRIPAGRYQITLRTEGGLHQKYGARFPWHRGMLWLRDVPDFEWVYIHVGNKDDDTEGCLLVGDGQTQNVTDLGSVTGSVSAYRRLYHHILESIDADDPVWIDIEDFA